nr:DUF2637 domain-containing protein [Paenarthrobacter sp. Z7-10]
MPANPAFTKSIAERAAGPILVVVALAGTVLSFSGIRSLALASGFSAWLAWLLPVSIDGMVLAGVLQVLGATASGTRVRYGWALTAAGAVVSVAANSLTASSALLAAVPQDITSAVVHGLPPATVLMTLEAWLSIRREGIRKERTTAANTQLRVAGLGGSIFQGFEPLEQCHRRFAQAMGLRPLHFHVDAGRSFSLPKASSHVSHPKPCALPTDEYRVDGIEGRIVNAPSQQNVDNEGRELDLVLASAGFSSVLVEESTLLYDPT